MASHWHRRLSTVLGHVKQKPVSNTYSTSVRLSLSTEKALVDDKVEISVSGLTRRQKITLHTYLKHEDKVYGSCAHFEADDAGIVSTFQNPSLGGSYTGLEPMGLFWSMKNQPSLRQRRLVMLDVSQQWHTLIGVQDGFLEETDLPWSSEFPNYIQHKTLVRSYKGQGVRRIYIEKDGVYGTLFLPAGQGPFPSVMDMYGFSGGLQERRACLLASRGIAAFALAYTGYKDLPQEFHEIDYHYYLRAFDLMAHHPDVDPKALGLLTLCVGGGYGFMVAARRPQVKCLGALNPLGYPGGLNQMVEGEMVKSMSDHSAVYLLRDGKMSFPRDGNDHPTFTFFPTDNSIPIQPAWHHGAKILVLKGEEDPCISSEVTDVIKRAIPSDFKKNVEFIYYPGAGHLIEPPFTPLCHSSYVHVFQCVVVAAMLLLCLQSACQGGALCNDNCKARCDKRCGQGGAFREKCTEERLECEKSCDDHCRCKSFCEMTCQTNRELCRSTYAKCEATKTECIGECENYCREHTSDR